MTRFFLITVLCGWSLCGWSQSLSFGPSQEEENFFFRVKTIDEFIQRFNDDPNSSVRQELRKSGNEEKLTRRKLLFTLFNMQNEKLQSKLSSEFYNFVLDTAHPRYINFQDSGWYARAACDFLYDNKPVHITLLLKVKHSEKGTKWVIAGIGDLPALDKTPKNTDSIAENKIAAGSKSDSAVSRYIPPNSHAVNFLELKQILKEGMDEKKYFDASVLNNAKGQTFVNLIKASRLVFLHSSSVMYYFMQIPGWMFEVAEFPRQSKNSGWLINDVRKMNTKEKEKFKLGLLHRS